MVPIYSIDSFLSLRFKTSAIYLNTMRETYEAYVIYSFTVFLMNFVALSYEDQKGSNSALDEREVGRAGPGDSIAMNRDVTVSEMPRSVSDSGTGRPLVHTAKSLEVSGTLIPRRSLVKITI